MQYLYWTECPEGGGTYWVGPLPFLFDSDGKVPLCGVTKGFHRTPEELQAYIDAENLPLFIADPYEGEGPEEEAPVTVQAAEPVEEPEDEVDDDLDYEFEDYPKGGEL